MNQNMFIRNGVLAIILPNNNLKRRLNKRFSALVKSFHSMRFMLIIIITAIGLIPVNALEYSISKMYKNNLIDNKIMNVSNQLTQVARKLGQEKNGFTQGIVNYGGELELISEMYGGRILLVNSQMYIVSDTYVFDKNKTILSADIIAALKGNGSVSYTVGEDYIEIRVPVKDNTSELITGVVVMILSTEDVLTVVDNVQVHEYTFRIIILVAVLLCAVALSKLIMYPLDKMNNSLKEAAEGLAEEKLKAVGYTETELMAEYFNKMIDKMRKLDESRQEFVSNVSHELKTPITSIKVLAESLNSQEDVPNELYKEFMGDIVVEIDRENKIINDLLSLVKMDKTTAILNITTVNINELLEATLKRLRPIAKKKNIELVLESFRPVAAEIDEVKMTLAISNLVENAIKYNNKDGWVRVSLNADHSYFYIKIEDNGIGIPQESQEFVFDRFYRVDKARSRESGGTGLGLSIVKNSILMHKGTIKLYSKEGEGTTFTIRIPLSYVSN